MEINTLRVESSLWIGSKRYRAALSGWYFSWTELDKKNREKKTGKVTPSTPLPFYTLDASGQTMPFN